MRTIGAETNPYAKVRAMMSYSKFLSSRVLVASAALAASALLGGCAVELQNRQAAQELKQSSAPQGSVYTGWRVFQDKCAACHGPDATGTANAPNLLTKVRDMGPRQFVNLVLRRYDWNLSKEQKSSEGAAREALIDSVVQRKTAPLAMPAWQSEPSVNAHIADLYAYLAARSDGTQGPGRPAS